MSAETLEKFQTIPELEQTRLEQEYYKEKEIIEAKYQSSADPLVVACWGNDFGLSKRQIKLKNAELLNLNQKYTNIIMGF